MRTQIALIPGKNNGPDMPGYGEIKGNPVFRIRVTQGDVRDSVGEMGDPARGLTGENLRADGSKTPGWFPRVIAMEGEGKTAGSPGPATGSGKRWGRDDAKKIRRRPGLPPGP